MYSVDDISDWESVGGITTDDGWSDGYGLFFNKSKLGFYINRYDNFAESEISMVETWNYVVGTYDKDAGGTDEIKVYVNGVKGTKDGDLKFNNVWSWRTRNWTTWWMGW